jgi:hypothetical protein
MTATSSSHTSGSITLDDSLCLNRGAARSKALNAQSHAEVGPEVQTEPAERARVGGSTWEAPMIWESHPWREDLCRVADRLDAWKAGVDWDDEYVVFEIERDVMLSAYAIRKLLEAHKVADSLARSTLRVEALPLIGRVPDYMNWHRLDEFYDFTRATIQALTIAQLCNQFIHSFIWMIERRDVEADKSAPAGLAGCFVASETQRSSSIYRVSIDVLIDLLHSVETEDVVSTQMTRDSSGQWQISNRSVADGIDPL